MDTNTIQLIGSFGSKLDAYVNALASKAGVAADHFYPIFVRQQSIEGWTQLGLIVFFATIMVLLVVYGVKSANHLDRKSTDSEFGKCVCVLFVAVILMFGLLKNLGETKQAIGKIANPEYYAVQSLVNMVK